MPEFVPTPEQQAILAHDPRRHARLLAGPGTGKSATLVAWVEQLLAGTDPPRIRLLTFTRAATAELAKKIADHPTAAVERPSTIHSFSISVLLQNPGAGDFPEPLRIVDDWEYAHIVRPTLASRAGVSVKRLDILVQEMAANWESLSPAPDARVNAAERARFLGAWNGHRGIYGYTLLAELPFALRNVLHNHSGVEGINYDLLLIDEYQDLNACDLDLIRLLASRGCTIVAAGDDDQSIYRFRNAAPEGIRRFGTDYPGSGDYPLSVTQRCGSRIIEWTSYVIAGDPDRPQGRPPLQCVAGAAPGEVALLSFPGQVAEAKGVARLAKQLIDIEGIPPSEILILLRSDYAGSFSNPIKEQLDALGVPYSDTNVVQELLSQADNRKMLEVFRLFVNRKDSLAWASLLKLANGIGSSLTDYIYDLARAGRCQFGHALLDAFTSSFPNGPAGSSRRAHELIRSVLAWLDAHPLPAEGENTPWGNWIIGTAGGDIAPSPSSELKDILLKLDGIVEPGEGLGRFLSQIRPLGEDLKRAESQGVRIMSMASAKGLTVRATIVAATEEDLIPRPEADLAEERRLLYVAMTRSREYIYATWSRRRRGPTARAGRSRVGLMRRHSH